MVPSRIMVRPAIRCSRCSPFPTPSSGLPLLSGLDLTAGCLEPTFNRKWKTAVSTYRPQPPSYRPHRPSYRPQPPSYHPHRPSYRP
ncbi:MAG: hypothetical protein WCL14_10390, partial [Bacteroidota bacterium]